MHDRKYVLIFRWAMVTVCWCAEKLYFCSEKSQLYWSDAFGFQHPTDECWGWVFMYLGMTVTNAVLYDSFSRVTTNIRERRLDLAGHYIFHLNKKASKLVLWQSTDEIQNPCQVHSLIVQKYGWTHNYKAYSGKIERNCVHPN